MVQRKVANKLGIQADQIKSEKLSATLGPSSHQNHDGKTRGTDLKKKMKRSRSMKLSSFDGSRSSLFRKEVPQPGRPPPHDVQMSPATPQKQSPVKLKGAVPNYMKSTSCSVARKECSQVTSQTTKTGSDSKNLHRRTSSASKPTPVSSGNTSPENLKRSSSLKLVRTLTKTPSFKPARSSVKRCSKVVLCADMDAQKATCSSTLKESKFPEYLTLNPGGTEAEGTSAMKVCPYTYCSLNGHHHARSPPLKCFLSARRRLMKTQKNAKVVPLSPNDGCIDSKPASEEEKIGLEFFVEIYAKNEDENSSSIGRDDGIKEEMVELEGGSKDEESVTFGVSADKEKEEYAGDEHSDKRLSDASSRCEDDLKQHLEGRVDESDEMVEGESLCEESVELLESCSEDSDMEWDAGEYADSELDGEATYSTEEDNLSCSDYEYISEIEDPTLHKIDAVACETMDSNWKDISDDQVLKEGKHASFEVQMPSLGMEVEGTDEAPQDSEPSHIFDYLSYSDDSSKEDEFEEVKSLNGSGPSSIEEVIAEVKSSFKEDEEENIPGADNTNANVLLNAVCDGSNSLDMIGDAPYDPKNTELSRASELDARPGLTEDEEAQVHTDLTTKGSSLDEEIIHNDVGETTKETGDNNESESEATILIPAQPSKDSCKADDDAPTLAVDDSEEQEDPRTKRSYQDEYSGGEPDEMGREKTTETDSADSILEEDSSTKTKSTRIYTRLKSNHDEEPIDICLKGTIRCKRSSEPTEDLRDFMPKEPNFLPLPPEPDTERVDLRHQMTDDRKNSEEWMIDYALRQTVTKLAPARKRKVALLVEAFEKVMPTSKYETHVQSTSASSPHARPIQACS